MNSKIIILSGKIHSGKTTELMEWSGKNSDCAGILAPVIDGKRFLKLLPSGDIFPLEALENGEKDILTCGKYKFYETAFKKANEYICNIDILSYKTIIIDEAGFLELNDSGLNDSIDHLLVQIKVKNPELRIIIVVRDYLVEKIKKKYNIKECEVITKETLEALK